MREEFLRDGGLSKYLVCGGECELFIGYTFVWRGQHHQTLLPHYKTFENPNCSSSNILTSSQAVGFRFRGVSKKSSIISRYISVGEKFNCVWTFFNKIVGQFWYCRGGWCRLYMECGVVRPLDKFLTLFQPWLLRVCPGVRSPLSHPSCYRTHLTQLAL